MARDSSGNFSLPAGNPVVTLTTIASAWANGTFTDVATEITNSLDRYGRGGMLAQLKAFAGTALLPGIAWDSEPGMGFYRASAGQTRFVIGNQDVLIITSAGPEVYDIAGGTAFRTGWRDIPQNSRSADYTLALSDAGKMIFHPAADTTARTWTIPANASVAFPIGTTITFRNQLSAGVINIAITSDTLRWAGTALSGARALAANGVCTICKETATEWFISGSGLS